MKLITFFVASILAGAALAALLSASGCAHVQITDGEWTANADTVLKDPKVGSMTVLKWSPQAGFIFLHVTNGEDSSEITGAQIATIAAAVAKALVALPIPAL